MNTAPRWIHNGQVQRSLCVDVTWKGTTFTVDYLLDGGYLPATDTDAAERPTVEIMGVQINGCEVWGWLRDSYVGEELQQAVERELDRG